jgi:hypothetical protein
MNLNDARLIAEDLRSKIEPACVPGRTLVVGSVRRKRQDVGDIEILGMPILRAPKPEFGQPLVFETMLDKVLYELVRDGWLHPVKGGPRMKQFEICLGKYNLKSLNPFHFELYLVIHPAQWGVLSLIRTGPAKQDDNFSKWCVTNRSQGGILPDGFRVKNGAVWKTEQIDFRGSPRSGEIPIEMPDEIDFFEFLGLDFFPPEGRHAKWRIVSHVP